MTHTRSVGLLWTRDRTSQTTYDTKKKADIHALVGFEPAVLASEWPQIYAFDRAATGIVGLGVLCVVKKELRMCRLRPSADCYLLAATELCAHFYEIRYCSSCFLFPDSAQSHSRFTCRRKWLSTALSMLRDRYGRSSVHVSPHNAAGQTRVLWISVQWKPYSPSRRTANIALLCTLSSDMGSDSRALLRSVNEFVCALHIFIARFRRNSVWVICTWCCSAFVNLESIGAGKPVLFLLYRETNGISKVPNEVCALRHGGHHLQSYYYHTYLRFEIFTVARTGTVVPGLRHAEWSRLLGATTQKLMKFVHSLGVAAAAAAHWKWKWRVCQCAQTRCLNDCKLAKCHVCWPTSEHCTSCTIESCHRYKLSGQRSVWAVRMEPSLKHAVRTSLAELWMSFRCPVYLLEYCSLYISIILGQVMFGHLVNVLGQWHSN